ncbi:MAG: hypothetical protein AB1454_12350 [Candidatus Auribacterota bacterium]
MEYSDNFIAKIRKFKLDDLLYVLAEMSRKIYINKMNDPTSPPFSTRLINKGFYYAESNRITPWQLAKLSYLGILHSNDHRSTIPTETDIFSLNEILLKEDNEIYTINREEYLNNPDDLKLMLWHWLTQEQVLFQDGTTGLELKYNFLRYYVIINKMSRSLILRHNFDPIDELKRLTGFTIDEFSNLSWSLLIYGWLCQSKVNFNQFDALITQHIPVVTPSNLYKISENFSTDYNYYREKHRNNPLITKPIVITQNNELIIANTYLFAIKVCENIYWLLKEHHSNKFGSLFGYYYENYIREVLAFYLTIGQFEKIRDTDGTQADWKIESNEFVLLIEQKSAIMTIGLKRFYADYGTLVNYFNNHFIAKGFPQLKKTAENLEKQTTKPIIKLLLHFEKMYMKDYSIKPYIQKVLGWDTKRYYFIDTVEFEQIIQLLSKDEKKFNEVIEKKILYEDSESISFRDGTDFYDILKELKYFSKVDFLEKESESFKPLNLPPSTISTTE